MTIKTRKPVAEMSWSKHQGMTYGVKADGIPVWLECRSNDKARFSFIKGLWHPGDQQDQSDSQFLLVCPACEAQLRIPGTGAASVQHGGKTFQYELLGKPVAVRVPDQAEPQFNTLRLSIAEDIGCPACRQMFRITDNTLHLI